MKILTLDASTIKTGVAVFNDTDLSYFTLIDLHTIKDPDERFVWMCNEIEHIINKTKPDFVVVEDIQLQGNVKTLIRLARLQGVILYQISQRNLDYQLYESTKWRRILGLKGGSGVKRPELKKCAIDYVNKCYGISPGEDICESICMGLAHLKNNNLLPDLEENTNNG